ncbi:Slp family lipoprotein [Sinimarinibacterium flocculans]|uniref:Outer membrane lipoprotein n=1 Tax=Sinimarinibacterium flocculans TaxID=985250 RepID=A0A318E9B5_9GAMM|nr:Slp family lipoprotein [Sinimarinibacterium flocculans]PXV67223.1 outer membrane lipoprotein [Sinimarinibacterium flocculans]
MRTSTSRRLLTCSTLLSTALLGACATAPESLRGEFAELTPAQIAGSGEAAAQRVRWGGTVLSVRNSEQNSCFEVLSRPLRANARPKTGDEEQGRFLACFADFKDPKVFEPGREVTVIGSIEAIEPVKVDAFEYRYPKLAGTDVYLWPVEQPRDTVYVVDPFPFYGYGYYYYPTYYHVPRRSGTAAAPEVSAPQQPRVLEREPTPLSVPELPGTGGLLRR